MSAFDTLKAAFEASLHPSPTVIFIGLAVVLFVPILLHFIFSATTPYTTLPSVLLIGPSGAGKTALVTLFERGPLASKLPSPVAKTHTSQVPSATELAISTDPPTSSFTTDLDAAGATAKKFLLVDTPGHPKLRAAALAPLSSATPTISPSSLPAASAAGESNKSKIKALLFVVDAAALSDADSGALSATAEYLYEVLIALQKRFHRRSGSRAPASLPVLVAANKMDLFTALPAALVKSQLEGELGRIRKARAKGLLSSGENDQGDFEEEGEGWLGGLGNEKFSFEEMMEFDIEVEVIGGNVLGDGPGAEKWWRWIGERV
ncbi:hypothetical protein VTI74DRAFT_6175 [Chaetomium olivicolor]